MARRMVWPALCGELEKRFGELKPGEQLPAEQSLADFLNGDRKWNCKDVKYTSRLEGKVWTGALEVPLAEIRFEKDLLKNGCRFNVYRNCYYTKAGKETWEQGCFLPVYGAFGNVEKFGTLNLE